jgi:hypothetical protein
MAPWRWPGPPSIWPQRPRSASACSASRPHSLGQPRPVAGVALHSVQSLEVVHEVGKGGASVLQCTVTL